MIIYDIETSLIAQLVERSAVNREVIGSNPVEGVLKGHRELLILPIVNTENFFHSILLIIIL